MSTEDRLKSVLGSSPDPHEDRAILECIAAPATALLRSIGPAGRGLRMGPLKIKIRLDDPKTRAVWETCLRAREEVAAWPAWKRGEPAAPEPIARETCFQYGSESAEDRGAGGK